MNKETIPENEIGSGVTKEKGFFGKLSNGDFGLAKTYWQYGVLVGFVVNISTKAITSIGLLAMVMLVHFAYFIPLAMGTWRAANKYEGSKIWAVLAKIATILGMIMTFFALVALAGLLGQV